MRSPRFSTRFRPILFFVPLALCLGLGATSPAAAAVIYDFSLPANGSVGAVNIQLTFAGFLPEAALGAYPLITPDVTAFSSGTPVDASTSVAGVDVDAASTLFGMFLEAPGGGRVLYTALYPADFFVFGRTPTQTGTFLSSAGNVISDLALDMATPIATLVVTNTAVPEPSTGLLLGLGCVGVAAWRRLHRRSE